MSLRFFCLKTFRVLKKHLIVFSPNSSQPSFSLFTNQLLAKRQFLLTDETEVLQTSAVSSKFNPAKKRNSISLTDSILDLCFPAR